MVASKMQEFETTNIYCVTVCLGVAQLGVSDSTSHGLLSSWLLRLQSHLMARVGEEGSLLPGSPMWSLASLLKSSPYSTLQVLTLQRASSPELGLSSVLTYDPRRGESPEVHEWADQGHNGA